MADDNTVVADRPLFNAAGTPIVFVPNKHYFARLHWRLRHRLPIWVIYHPMTAEYPGLWITRMHIGLPKHRTTRFVMSHDTLEDLRAMLPPGLSRLPRSRDDPPEIAELWL